MIHTSRQLKDLVRNLSKETGIEAHVLIRKFIMAYPIETVLAEKLETLIARSVTNTRMRDFYDIHVLLNSKKQEIDYAMLQKALSATSSKRESTKLMKEAESVLVTLKNSFLMQDLWKSYQRKINV